jgi:putative ABC transport system permease protein
METLWQDVRFGARMLLRQPGFTVVAVLTLALGIGANTAIFSVIEAVLLHRLPFSESDRLAVVWENNFKRDRKTNVVGPANFMRWQEWNHSFERMAAFIEWPVNVTGAGEPERVPVGLVTSEFFTTLGVNAALGRAIQPDDGKPGAQRVLLLSDGYWKRKFGADPNVVGKTLAVNGEIQTIVGVMPADFRGLMVVDMWSPYVLTAEQRNTGGRWMVVVARLKPGVSMATAQAEMNLIAERTRADLPKFDAGWGVTVVPLREQLTGDVKLALLVLLGAVGLVLLIACANVANLLLARAATRAKELAIRAALGAGCTRLVRQLLTESVLLSLLGGGAGLLLASWGIDGLQTILPADLGRFTAIELNQAVLGFTVLLSMFTGLFFGAAPALAVVRPALQESLKEGGRSSRSASARPWVRNALVISEVALSLVLLTCAGLLLKSFTCLQSVRAGFNPKDVLSMQISLASSKYAQSSQQTQFYSEAVERMEQLPGVTSVGGISWQLMGLGSATSFRLGDRPSPPAGEEPTGEVRMVTSGWFRTMGVPLLRGRSFTPRDSAKASQVVVINETAAREFWPAGEPLGKHVLMKWGRDLDAEIIGVVGDVRLTALKQPPRATLYWPVEQVPNEFMTFMIRSSGDPMQLAGAVRTAIASIDPDQPVAKMQTMEEVVSNSLNQPRFTALLLAIFSGVAVTLAVVGIYGVLFYTVSQRTHEIGIRMALGAQRSDVLRMVLSHGMALTLLGVGIGLALALAASRFLQKLLFEVQPTDPITYAGVAALLAAVALVACYIPARRATKVDPMVALRYE